MSTLRLRHHADISTIGYHYVFLCKYRYVINDLIALSDGFRHYALHGVQESYKIKR